MTKEDCILFSGGAQGAEAEFGINAERFGIEEVNFTFEGHKILRHRGLRVLNHEELKQVTSAWVFVAPDESRYTDSPVFRRILQSIWHQINNGQEIYVIGKILDDKTVKGGTGWGAEFAKLCNKPLHVFDQERSQWFTWNEGSWTERKKGEEPVIQHIHFTGTGTRFLEESGRKAVEGLFRRSFT
jgi:hypothetical protein